MATVNKDFRVKNGLVVEGTTGTIDGNNIVTDADTTDVLAEGTTNLYFTDQRAKDAVTSGVNTDEISEGTTNLYFTDQRAQDAVTFNLSTDDLTEGTSNLYYTDSRVQDVLVNAVKENIEITSTDGILYITAENGVEDSTTDDLDEGTVNLYFTNTRVYDKVDSVLDFGTGIILTSDSEEETIVVSVDTEDIATVNYVNEVAQGLKVRGNVEAATTENLIGTYNNGTNGVDATLNLGPLATFEVDGWSDWEVEDGILVKDQDNAIENGRYFIFQVGDETTDWILKRCVRCDESEEIPGSFVFVQHGTQYGSTGWVATVDNLGTFTVGEDDINWVQFSGAGTFVGGTGIDIDGQEISIDFSDFSTDDISEGTSNLYYTNQRVRDVLTGSQQNNITITEYDGQLIIEAENGIADSTTDDLDEGTTNLYFTDQRAVDALEAVVPNFTEIEINSVSSQVAATTTLPGTSPVVVYSFDKTVYRSAKFLVKVSVGTHTEISEILLTLDTSDNIAITEYAIVGTNGNLGTVTATLNVDDVELTYTLASSSGTATIFGTLIA
jgi:hypothetical protein